MGAVVVYESIYGNTRAVAEAIAAGLGGAEVLPAHVADAERLDGADLVVAGGPTHMHGMTSSLSRTMAVKGAEDEGVETEEAAGEELGLRQRLKHWRGEGSRAAAFDTRIDRAPTLTGTAARGIAKRLRRAGFEPAAEPESFFVEDAEGPLADGELERARAWGESLTRAPGSS